MTQREVFSAAKKFNSDRHIGYRGDRKILDIEVVDVIKKKNDNMIQFIYKGDINKLLEILRDIRINNLLIEEPSLEEIFLHYYKED